MKKLIFSLVSVLSIIGLHAITNGQGCANGGTLEGGPFTFCIDGEDDFVSDITLTGNNGANSGWIITDEALNILGLPPMPSVVNFDGAGAGVGGWYSR